MYWVIQSNMYSEENFDYLLTALERLNVLHSVHKVVPFDHRLEPELVAPEGKIIAMGTKTLCEIATRRGWNPGSYMNANFDYVAQSEHWPDMMLNRHALVTTFGGVERFYTPIFMRPIDDSKAFSGTIVTWPEYVQWRERVEALKPEDNSTLTLTTKVLLAKPQEIFREFRLFVVNGKVVTGSLYKVGSRAVTQEIVERDFYWVNALVERWAPAKAFAIDVADTPDGWQIVEVNGINSAGWYKADMNKLVMALEEMER